MDADGDVTYTKTVMLAPVSGQLSILNGLTMKCLLRGILNDFKVTFKSRKPVWWPTHIPFESVTTAPAEFESMFRVMICNSSKNIGVFYAVGNWSDSLQEILASCYHHHGLDPETYTFKYPEDNSRERSFLPEELRPHHNYQTHLLVDFCQILGRRYFEVTEMN